MPEYRVQEVSLSFWKSKAKPDLLEAQLNKAGQDGWSFHSLQTVNEQTVIVFERR